MILRTISFFVSLLLFLSINSFSQKIDLFGKVLNKDNVPLFGVIATLKGFNLSDTTGSDGIYRFYKEIIPITLNSNMNNFFPVKFNRSILYFSVKQPRQSVSLDMFTVSGRKIESVLDGDLAMGNYSINPFGYCRSFFSAQIVIIRLRIGNEISYFKAPNMGNRKNGTLTCSPLNTTGLSERAQQKDTITFYREGQFITNTEISDYIDTLADLFITQRDIYGNFSARPKTFSSVKAIITGDIIPDSTPKIAELWYNEPNQSYSGFVYFVYTPQVLNYSVYVGVYNKDSAFIGHSVNVKFPSTAGDINIPPFDPNNAEPSVNAGKDTTVSIYDTIRLHATAVDSFGGTIVKWEWDFGNTGTFVITSTSDTAIIVPKDSNPSYICKVRATDDDGNTATDSMRVVVCQDVPVITICYNTSVSINDSIHLSAIAKKKFGNSIFTWEWNIGNTGFVSTSTSDTDIVAPADSNPRYECIARVTDDHGNKAMDTMFVVVCQDVPQVYAGKDTAWPMNSQVTLNPTISQKFGSIVKYEWNINGTGFKKTSSCTTIVTPDKDTCYYPLIVRVTDDDGNVGVDTVNITVGVWVRIDNGNPYFNYGSSFYFWNEMLYGATVGNHKASLVRYNGSIWERLGSIDDINIVGETSDICIVNGVPYIEAIGPYYTKLLRLNGTTLNIIADVPFDASLDVINDTLYNVFEMSMPPYDSTFIVNRFNGTQWEMVGDTVELSFPEIYSSKLALLNDTFYIACKGDGCVYVMKFNGTKWELVNDNFIVKSYCTFFIVNKMLYLWYAENGIINLVKFNSLQWEFVGKYNVQIKADPIFFIISDGIPYIAGILNNRSAKSVVMRYNGTEWIPVGNTIDFLPGITIHNIRNLFISNKNKYLIRCYSYTGGSNVAIFNLK